MKHSLRDSILTVATLLFTLFAGAFLVASHAPLSSTFREDWLQSAAGRELIHFGSDHCQCSQRLVSYLLTRGAQPGLRETLVWFGPPLPEEDALHAAGYNVRYESSPEASGIVAAPWLIVRSQQGQVVYSGGYEPAPRWEKRILYNVEHRFRQASLSTTGCATSRQIRAASTALRWKELVNGQ
jgi:hypothetical protein